VKTSTQLVQLAPDHLVVGLYIGNDFMDLLRQDDRPYLTADENRTVTSHSPHFMVLQNPADPPSFLSSSRLYALSRAALGPTVYYQVSRGQLLWHNLSQIGRGPVDIARYMWDVKRLTNISLGLMTQSLLQQVWFRHFPETFQTASLLNRHVMALFQQLCREKGIRLTYVLIPTKVRVEPNDVKGLLDKVSAYDSTLNIESLAAFEDRLASDIRNAGAALGVEVIDLTSPLMNSTRGVRHYYPEDMHLNATGNAVVAEVLREQVFNSTPSYE
jgi:hypothetical protein